MGAPRLHVRLLHGTTLVTRRAERRSRRSWRQRGRVTQARRVFHVQHFAVDPAEPSTFEAPPGCDLWPVTIKPLVVGAQVTVLIVWSEAPPPLPPHEPARPEKRVRPKRPKAR